MSGVFEQHGLFRAALGGTAVPEFAAGAADVHVEGEPPTPIDADGRAAMHFGRDACVRYPVAGNFNRQGGTVMLWFRPDWPADFEDTLGRILWDLRIDHGSVVADDPSQRWALVYPNPSGRKGGRGEDTLCRWRFCVATNRNRFVIGTRRERPDRRTRQAVFGSRQRFAAGQWMHLAVTWSPTRGAIYIDGRLDAEAALPEGLPDRSLPETMSLGARPTWINAGACGAIAEFRIYDTPLDASAIADESAWR